MPIIEYILERRREKHRRRMLKLGKSPVSFDRAQHLGLVGANTRFKPGEMTGNKSHCWKGGPFRKYGLSVEQYDRILEAQGGVCAICLKAPKKQRLNVDHDHKTGVVRGLLCFRCNYGIGWFQDDAQRLGRMASYLSSDTDWRDLDVSA